MKTFKQFCKTSKIEDSPERDFIEDFNGDQRHKKITFKSFDELEVYLMRRNACRAAISAAKNVWSLYERSNHGN